MSIENEIKKLTGAIEGLVEVLTTGVPLNTEVQPTVVLTETESRGKVEESAPKPKKKPASKPKTKAAAKAEPIPPAPEPEEEVVEEVKAEAPSDEEVMSVKKLCAQIVKSGVMDRAKLKAKISKAGADSVVDLNADQLAVLHDELTELLPTEDEDY